MMLVTAGKVGAEEFKKAIMDMSSEGGKFGGLMEAQSKTISGQISNIEDAIDMMFNEIGQDSEGVINDALSGVSSLIEHYKEEAGPCLGITCRRLEASQIPFLIIGTNAVRQERAGQESCPTIETRYFWNHNIYDLSMGGRCHGYFRILDKITILVKTWCKVHETQSGTRRHEIFHGRIGLAFQFPVGLKAIKRVRLIHGIPDGEGLTTRIVGQSPLKVLGVDFWGCCEDAKRLFPFDEMSVMLKSAHQKAK